MLISGQCLLGSKQRPSQHSLVELRVKKHKLAGIQELHCRIPAELKVLSVFLINFSEHIVFADSFQIPR